MKRKLVFNEISQNRTSALITVLFITASAMLLSLTISLAVNLASSIDRMMRNAKTPHFMQMHTGKLDRERMKAFADGNPLVDDYQIVEFLNIENSMIMAGGKYLTDSLQDNGVCVQNPGFDLLPDLNNKIVEPEDGEIYLPVSLLKDKTAAAGDTAEIAGRTFTVAGFIRDSQMNATLASSKRFLVSPNDFSALVEHGSVEYLIEFRLKNAASIAEFQNSYSAGGLESNGPTLTYPLFRFINAVSDGIMIGVLLLISILISLIALLCIRFSLLARIEEEIREIGIMKAIGLHSSYIRKIYLARYRLLSAAGCIAGFILSLFLRRIFLGDIRLYMGESGSPLEYILGFAGTVLIYATVIIFISILLKRFKKIPAVEALRFGNSGGKNAERFHMPLSRNRLLNTNIILGLRDVLTEKRIYLTMLIVYIAAAFIMIVPSNLYTTISSRDFSSFMGIGYCDMRIDIQQTEDINGKTKGIVEALRSDSSVEKTAVLTTRTYRMRDDSGKLLNIKIESGDHSVFPVAYTKGRTPKNENEIALSSLNAEELGRDTGDILTLIVDGQACELSVSGIYSDITNGGKTAKTVFNDDTAPVMWSIVCVGFADKTDAAAKAAEYSKLFGFAKVSNLDEYIDQTFGSTIRPVKKAATAALAAALVISAIVTLMFITMLTARDSHSIAVMKAVGFRNSDIRLRYVSRAVTVLVPAIIAGAILSNTLGEALAGSIISSFGVSAFTFSVNPLTAYIIFPVLLIAVVYASTLRGTASTDRIKIYENITE